MQEIIKKYEKKIQDKNAKRRKLKIVTAIASLAVVCIVLWALILPGVAMSGQPKCGKEEHRHSDACYTEKLTCGQKETDGHTHTDACYKTEKKLICGQEESETHQHTDACYQEEKTLICGKQEEAAHHHTAACYTRELTCGKEEHTHTDECYSDPTADVENEDSWTTTFRHAELGDDWGKNVAAIAETQIGYRESSNNYSVSENREHKGYTRYTAWYGDYYKDWDTAFAAFCIHYAGVPNDAFPTDIKADEWIKKLQEKDWYADKTSEDYQVGDLIFLHKKNQETDTQVGVISKIFEKDGKTYIQTIEGNCDNQVKKNEYAVDDENISGYGLLCKAQMKYKADQMAQENAKSEAKARKAAAKKASAPVQTQNADEGTEDSKAVFYSNNENSTEKSVDQRLKVELSASTPTTTTGHTNSLKVVSTYSQANAPESSSHVCLKVGALPEGVSIEGFKDGVHIVNYQGHDIVLTLTEKNGEYYISYDQPAGSTLEFDVQFSSKNGVMPAQSQVTISVDKDKTKAPKGTVGIDSLDDSQTLTWTAKNEWDPVAKKVNGKDSDQTKIDGGKLTGIFKYTIQANSSNGENYGEIWTDYIDVTDTFTLPENISFPSGVKISDNKIVNENGELLAGSDGVNTKKLIEIAKPSVKNGSATDSTYEQDKIKYLVFSDTLDTTGWKIFGLRSRDSLLGSLQSLRVLIAEFTVIIFLAAFVALLLVSNSLTAALTRLEKRMSIVQGGDFEVRFFYPYQDEVGSLARSFNCMLDEIERLVKKQDETIQELKRERDFVAEVQKQKRKAELKALQAQINPHFLYNTLDSIIWMAETQDSNIVAMTEALAKLFRISLNKGNEEILLKKEMEHVKNYLIIQSMRYADKLYSELCGTDESAV